MKRTSITRLKQRYRAIFHAQSFSWNEKNLDYEIETWEFDVLVEFAAFAWNEKNLDYEIETRDSTIGMGQKICLKWKEPRLRDWNMYCPGVATFMMVLKWKEPWLRDWNMVTVLLPESAGVLEMKRTSITRLKQNHEYTEI